jgi:lactoylglutathione lyase
MDAGVTLNRPPHDGQMGFIRSPDPISIGLIQDGDALPRQKSWGSAENVGEQ